MPPKQKTPKGELTAGELRKLVRAHNVLTKITIPKGTDRDGIIKIIEDKNYVIDHVNKIIRPKVKRGKGISLKSAEEITKPKPKTEAQVKAAAEKKAKKATDTKEKEDKIKALGVKQGAALQRVIAKKKAKSADSSN